MFTHAWSCRSRILFCAITFWWFAVMLQKVTCCPCILTLLMNALPEKLLLSSWYPQMCTLSAFAYDSNSFFAFIVSFIVCHFAYIPSSLEKWSTNTIAAVYISLDRYPMILWWKPWLMTLKSWTTPIPLLRLLALFLLWVFYTSKFLVLSFHISSCTYWIALPWKLG